MASDSGMDWEPGLGVGVRSPPPPAPMYLDEQVGSLTPTSGVSTPTPTPAVTPAHAADTSATHYLAIDTNVFLSRFDEVRVLHDRLANLSVSAWILLPGRVVAGECGAAAEGGTSASEASLWARGVAWALRSCSTHKLDGLKSSIKPNPSPSRPDESLGETARRATNWLLSIARGQLRGGRGRVRGQKRTEQQAAASRFALAGSTNNSDGAGDDDILFCCLYFAERTPVSLWTDDRILSLRAETEHIATFAANTPLPAIARHLGVEWHGD